MRAFADRLGVAMLAMPCTIGNLVQEITEQVRELEDAEIATRQAQAGSEMVR